jgi:hypothetical protein
MAWHHRHRNRGADHDDDGGHDGDDDADHGGKDAA